MAGAGQVVFEMFQTHLPGPAAWGAGEAQQPQQTNRKLPKTSIHVC